MPIHETEMHFTSSSLLSSLLRKLFHDLGKGNEKVVLLETLTS